VSGLDTPWDDEDGENLPSTVDTSQSQRRQTACPGHERALPVNDVVRLLDMKEEGKSFCVVCFPWKWAHLKGTI